MPYISIRNKMSKLGIKHLSRCIITRQPHRKLLHYIVTDMVFAMQQLSKYMVQY
jgi:hypothetical protein